MDMTIKELTARAEEVLRATGLTEHGVSCLVWTWIERDFCYVSHDEETRTRTVRV
jgi:hypothetical protein